MGIKTFRPTTASRRYKTVLVSDLSDQAPPKALLKPIKKKAGRNSHGHITARHRGGGHKRKYRIIDFKRDKHNIPAVVSAISYDPNRSARIALFTYKDGEKRYVVAPDNLKVGQTVVSGPDADISVGNAMPLSRIPLGMVVHNVELRPGKGAQIARTAGTQVEIMAKENDYVQLKMPSGEIRLVRHECYATIGQVGNTDHQKVVLGSAGRSRCLGWRPYVRGACMNPVDHPNGGGEGKSKSGGGWHQMRSPWGNGIKGQKTRKIKKQSSRLILKRRKKK